MNRGEATAALDALGIESLCDKILAGETMTDIAKAVGVSKGALIAWIAADRERAALVHEARVASAEAFDDAAEQVLKDACGPIEVTRARELAHHYRWRAAKRDPARYSEKHQLTGANNAPLLLVPEIDHMDVARRLAFLLARAAHANEQPPPLLTYEAKKDPMRAQYPEWMNNVPNSDLPTDDKPH